MTSYLINILSLFYEYDVNRFSRRFVWNLNLNLHVPPTAQQDRVGGLGPPPPLTDLPPLPLCLDETSLFYLRM